MEYRSIEKFFHMDRSPERFERYKALADERRMADASFRTGIATDSGELFLAVPRELSVLNENVLRYERRISRLASELPQVAFGALVRDLIISEVVSTNELEGVHSTRKQIHDVIEMGRESPNDTRRKRFGELANLYVNLVEEKRMTPKTPEDIRTIYDLVMYGEDLGGDAPDGRLFRSGEVAVYNEHGIAVHEGLYPESKITEAMQRMLELVASEEIPQIYSAVIGHFVFEYAHPFYDGNGRTGRYLLALWLSDPLSILTSLSLSRVIFDNKDSYYRAFNRAERKLMCGELTFFVMKMLEFVRVAQDGLEIDLADKRRILDEAWGRLEAMAADADLCQEEKQILYMLAQIQLFASISEVKLLDIADHIELGTQTARKYTKSLESRGLVETVSKNPLRFVLTYKACQLLGLNH